jgi:starch-binding outer membrane protein, SusD/RagB family
MLKKYIYSFVLIFVFGSLSSCTKLLETQPRQSVDANLAIQDITGLRALLLSAYDGLQGAGYYGQRMMIAPDIMADNVRLTNSNSNRYFTERVNTIGTLVAGVWGSYGTVNRKKTTERRSSFLA